VKYAAAAGKIAALRERLEEERRNVAALAVKRRLAEAHKRRDVVLDDFDARMFAGRFAEAAGLVAAEKGKLDGEAQAAVGAELAAAERSAREIAGFEAGRRAALPRWWAPSRSWPSRPAGRSSAGSSRSWRTAWRWSTSRGWART